jgi:hypothetical protein
MVSLKLYFFNIPMTWLIHFNLALCLSCDFSLVLKRKKLFKLISYPIYFEG